VRRRRVVRKVSFGIALVFTVLAATFAQGASAVSPKAAAPPAPSTGDISKINHVVVLMQENRSFDSYFSQLHFDGQPKSSVESQQPNPTPLGGPGIHPFLTTDQCTVADLDHGWDATHREIDGGKMDGFTTENAVPADPSGSRAMGYFNGQTLPFYYDTANQFAVADRYFASVPGPTYPNRFYLLTGTSFGYVSNVTKVYNQKTIFESLEDAGVSWKIYLTSLQVEVLFQFVQDHQVGHLFPISQYYTDAANGNLPQVSFLESDPFGDVNHESDEHPPANVQVGEKFTHDAMDALVHSPNWSSSAFFLTYDEHGGYYDHVTPPAAVPPDDIPPMVPPGDPFNQFNQLGVRVPTMVVSPYAKAHYVSHTVFDHTSILKFIETRFGLAPLTRRDAAANNMTDMFDFSHISHPNPVLANAPIDPAGEALCQQLHGGEIQTEP
jgi:phospholipase C